MLLTYSSTWLVAIEYRQAWQALVYGWLSFVPFVRESRAAAKNMFPEGHKKSTTTNITRHAKVARKGHHLKTRLCLTRLEQCECLRSLGPDQSRHKLARRTQKGLKSQAWATQWCSTCPHLHLQRCVFRTGDQQKPRPDYISHQAASSC